MIMINNFKSNVSGYAFVFFFPFATCSLGVAFEFQSAFKYIQSAFKYHINISSMLCAKFTFCLSMPL